MKKDIGKYRTSYDLARLDYFEIRHGDRLVLSDPKLGPSIDYHTHLALAFGPPMQVDLHRTHARTAYYLPLGRPLDLAIYANQNFTPTDLTRMKVDLTLMGLTGSGMRATHTIPDLTRDMEDLGIEISVLLAIDQPVLSSNAETYLKETAGRRDFVVYGSVHPYSPHIERRLDRQSAMGARGVKLHPNAQLMYPNTPRANRIYRACGERGMHVFYHCGPVGIEPEAGRRRSQVRLYEQGIAENPETTFILGHSGALQMETALDFCKRYPNVYLELSSQGLPNVRTIVEQAPSDRILFGSDWPFYHQAMPMAKIFIATEGDETLRRKVLYENAARLLTLRDT